MSVLSACMQTKAGDDSMQQSYRAGVALQRMVGQLHCGLKDAHARAHMAKGHYAAAVYEVKSDDFGLGYTAYRYIGRLNLCDCELLHYPG